MTTVPEGIFIYFRHRNVTFHSTKVPSENSVFFSKLEFPNFFFNSTDVIQDFIQADIDKIDDVDNRLKCYM